MVTLRSSRSLGRWIRTMALWLLALGGGLVLVGAGTASATGSSSSGAMGFAQFGEQIDSYDVQAEVADDGTARITETIDYDFGNNSRHGIERFIQVRFALNSDDPILEGRDTDARWERVTPLENISVSSPTGAPTDVEVIHEGSIERIRIGDPDKTVTGTATYVITYDLRGVVNAFDSDEANPEAYEEVPLNVVGDQWNVPIVAANAVVTMPASIEDINCVSGRYGEDDQCADASFDGSSATAKFAQLGSGRGATLYLKVPAGTFTSTEPILDEVWSLQRAFTLSPATVGAGAGLGALAAALVGLLGFRVGRDRAFVGSVVDQSFGSDVDDEQRLGLGGQDGITVEFVPPGQILPGSAGTIIDERADNIDVSATLIDLAVKGYLRIEDLTDGDYRLTQLNQDHTGLVEYEKTLLTSLFASGSETTLGELKYSFSSRLKIVQSQMYDDMVSHGWYRKRPDQTRAAWLGVGFMALLVSGALSVALIAFTRWALIGIPLVLAALALMALSINMPARTGKGTAMYRRVLGFREMFAAGEGDRQNWAAEQNLFSHYLPYAMVFGMTERWAQTFAQLSAEGVVQPEQMGWWVSPRPFDWIIFSHSLNHFGSYAAGTFSAVQRSSAGGAGGMSGFGGGGFSGGGFGGGGGGSW